MSVYFKIVGVMLLCAVAYLSLWPVPIKPIAWASPVDQKYTGKFSANHKLNGHEKLTLDGLHGPEAAAQDSQGNWVASTHEGWIVRWREGSTAAEKWLDVGGRPLGLAFDAQDNLWVANAYLGLQRVTPSGTLSTELDKVNDSPLKYADDVVVALDGKVYFSDASTRFGAQENGGTLPASLLDIMEHSKSGRVIVYDPATKESKVLFDGLTFANGVAIAGNGEFLLLAETGEYRIHKLWLTPEREGQSELIVENLPGFPDNIHRGLDGRFWVGLAAPRSKLLDDLSDKPFFRKMIQRLPAMMHPEVVHYGHVLAFDENGQLLVNLQSPNGEVYTTTGVIESEDNLYVTSLTAPFLTKIRKSDLNLN